MALGKNIKYLRKMRGLRRPDVARALGLEGDQVIYALESRDSKRSDLAPILAQFFNVSLEILITSDLTGLTKSQIDQLPKYESPAQRSDKGIEDEMLSPMHANGYISVNDIMEFIATHQEASNERRRMLMDSVRAIRNGGIVGILSSTNHS